MRCTGIKLYSPWGVTVWNGSGPPSEIEYALCKRCAKKGA